MVNFSKMKQLKYTDKFDGVTHLLITLNLYDERYMMTELNVSMPFKKVENKISSINRNFNSIYEGKNRLECICSIYFDDIYDLERDDYYKYKHGKFWIISLGSRKRDDFYQRKDILIEESPKIQNKNLESKPRKKRYDRYQTKKQKWQVPRKQHFVPQRFEIKRNNY